MRSVFARHLMFWYGRCMCVHGTVLILKLYLAIIQQACHCAACRAQHMLGLTTYICMQVTHAFPAVLEKLELHPFDMCKIIDPFVRYEPTTPRDLKRHLHSIEEKILESLAWERGSSLYPLLVMAAEHQDLNSAPAKGQYGNCTTKLLPQPQGCHTCLFSL